jgi:threonine dehydratase
MVSGSHPIPDSPSAADLLDARQLIAPTARVTPLIPAPWHSAESPSYLKLESLQRTGSYKLRGATVFVRRCLREQPGTAGFVAASAGNHAQGVALAARDVGLPATVVMPLNASPAKIEATRRLGARVVLHGADVVACLALAHQLADETGLSFVPPFDSVDIIAGQATVGMEILDQLPSVQTIVVPVGGGGLLAGVGAAILHADPAHRAAVRIVAVEASGAASLSAALQVGHPVLVPTLDTIADGIAVAQVGDLTFAWAQRLRDAGILTDVVTVDDAEIAAATIQLLDEGKVLVEPSGAAAAAAILTGRIVTTGTTVTIISGGNLDLALIPGLVNSHLARASRLHTLTFDLPDHSGALSGVVLALSEVGANILDVRHNRHAPLDSPNLVRVEISLQLKGEEHLRTVLDGLNQHGFSPVERSLALPTAPS